MSRLVSPQPLQGSLYQQLQVQIAQNYSGLGPRNIGPNNPYSGMTGQCYQQPLSASTTRPAILGSGNPHR